ncbi:MAG: hypothetical protein IH973_14700 [Myxococcales bacterium]|nr:hypothetical protein [Myxococcales bacterium]
MSLSLTFGLTFQTHKGAADSTITDTMTMPLVSAPLRDPVMGDDLAASPLMGGSLEVMTPTLPLPMRPRLFFSGELLTLFAPRRDLALEGDPSCLRGPEPGIVCARDEFKSDVGGFPQRNRGFGDDAANGLGTRLSARVGTLAYGLNLGAAFPFKYRERQFRLKPSLGWINYEIEASGTVVDGDCDPDDICTDYRDSGVRILGFHRETILKAKSAQRFNAIGPGLDLEMDAGHYGPFGVALFMSARAYAVLGDRTISFRAQESFDDAVGNDISSATYNIEIDPWLYRASIGIRFLFLGGEH